MIDHALLEYSNEVTRVNKETIKIHTQLKAPQESKLCDLYENYVHESTG